MWALRAEIDDVVPREQCPVYVAAAKAAGGTAEEVVVPGDHDSIADPDAPSFPALEKLITEALGRVGS